MEKSERHPIWVLDLLIVVIAVGLLVAASKFGLKAGHRAMRGPGAVIGGVYVLYLGLLVLLSHFFSRRSFVFRFLDYVCRECSRPSSRGMAWFYFALCVAIGSVLLLIGFGVL
jgi:hypothetical protein